MNHISDYTVQIFVTFDDGATRLGTGYPVAKDRLLTARHVVQETGKTVKTIEVRWFCGDKEKESQWISATIEMCCQDVEVDIAVLTSEFPQTAKGPFPILSAIQPGAKDLWQSWGYPAVGQKNEGLRQIISAQGDLHETVSWNKTIDLGVDYKVSQSGGWVGISGAPVVVNRCIVGVITLCPNGFDQARLYATSIKAAMVEDGFKQAVRINDETVAERRDAWAQERSNFLLFLYENTAISSYIDQYNHQNPQEIFDQRLIDFLINIEIACKKMEKGRHEHTHTMISDLCQHALDVSNSLVDEVIIDEILKQRQGIGLDIRLSIATSSMAEIVMSAIDRRSPSFQAPKSQLGKLAVPNPPTHGLIKDPQKTAEDVERHLIKELIDAYDTSSPYPEKKGLLKDLLDLSLRRNQSRYLVISSINEQDNNTHLAAMRILINNYKSLAVIYLNTESKVLRNELTLPEVIASLTNFITRTSS
jgi:hypothetical protein